jgi:hypothetical protein
LRFSRAPAKKNPLPPSGLVTDFLLFLFGVRLGHYQPSVIIADDDPGDDNENKAKEVDDGNRLKHSAIPYLTSR